MSRRGFTLIEVMLSIAFGLVIVGTATAGFTVASKILVQSERLSRENQLIRAAYQSATAEVDFWFSVDDPFDPAGQQQRVVSGGTGDGGNGNVFAPIQLPPEFCNWQVMSPKTWHRGGMRVDDRMGDNGDDAKGHKLDHSITSRVNDPDPVRAVVPNGMDQIFTRLGIYGMMNDYLPVSFPASYFVEEGGLNTFGDIMTAKVQLKRGRYSQRLHKGRALYDATGEWDHHPWQYNYGRFALGHNHYIGVVPREGWNEATAGTVHNDLASRGRYRTDNWWNSNLQRTLATDRSFRVRPESWPKVHWSVFRMEEFHGRNQRMRIVIDNPITGTRQVLGFTMLGTSLRGARMQRDWTHFNAPATPIDGVAP